MIWIFVLADQKNKLRFKKHFFFPFLSDTFYSQQKLQVSTQHHDSQDFDFEREGALLLISELCMIKGITWIHFQRGLSL